MSESLPTGEEEKVTVYLLMKDADGRVIGIGNSHECSPEEADELVRTRQAKFIDVPLEAAEVEEEGE